MEQIFEAETVNTLNRSDAAIGSGVPNAEDGNQALSQAEASAVTKQTAETLMAGERIIEALDLADAERVSVAEYQNAIAGLSSDEIGKVPLPQKNAILAAYELEPEAYVLKVVEKIISSALMDALLVLPFGKVMSLMVYLDEWAKRVCGAIWFSNNNDVDSQLSLRNGTSL
jgi:U3 small nucleolar RNA-associated protein 12